jgi:cardiolipin synthase
MRELTALPNLLTLLRIVLIVPVVALLFYWQDWARWAALALFVVASVTDWLDGKLARQQGLVSPLGRFLDPIADKLLVAAVLVMLAAVGQLRGLEVVAVILILSRELLVSGLREYLGEKGVVVKVSQLAKWKTTVQMVALTLLIAAPALGELALGGFWQDLGVGLLWLAVLLTLITGWDYLRTGLREMGVLRPR